MQTFQYSDAKSHKFWNIEVSGTIPVKFADYQIDNPSTAGITTQDNGVVEFLLVFDKS